MNEPMMGANIMESHMDAFESTNPGMKAAIKKLLDAGVPWLTIIQKIIQYGPAFIQMIAQIIQDWQNPKPPTHAV